MATSLYRKKGEQFFDNAGNRLIAGKIYYYQAGTTTLEPTYSDQAGNTANTNPVILNGDGRLDNPVYLGSDNDYKELVVDSSDATIDPWPFDNIPKAVDNSTNVVGFSKNLIAWQQVTSAQSPKTISSDDAGSGFEVDLTGGNVVLNLPSAATMGNGKGIFLKIVGVSGTNSLTVNPANTQTIDAGSSFVASALNFASQIVSNGANYDVVSGYFPAPPLAIPTGRLTLTQNTPVINADVVGASTVYYTSVEGNTIPVWNGSTFLFLTFSSDISLTLNASAASNTIVDVFGFNNGGVPQIGFGPAWQTSTAGSGARGTGAGTTELGRTNGLWTNKNDISLTNGSNTYSVPASKATYLGSLLIDSSAGQVTCHVTWGQSRKWGIWNAYNRAPITLQAGDSTSSWTSVPASFRASNNSTNNSISVFTGLTEERVVNQFLQMLTSNNRIIKIGIGWNSTTAASGTNANWDPTSGSSGIGTVTARYDAPPFLGLATVTALESGSADTNASFSGTQANMLLTAMYRA